MLAGRFSPSFALVRSREQFVYFRPIFAGGFDVIKLAGMFASRAIAEAVKRLRTVDFFAAHMRHVFSPDIAATCTARSALPFSVKNAGE